MNLRRQKIIEAWAEGLTAVSIAELYGVTPRYVFKVQAQEKLPRRPRGRRKTQ
jgi:uncharacterized protein YjcR